MTNFMWKKCKKNGKISFWGQVSQRNFFRFGDTSRKILQKYYNLTNFKKMLEKSMPIVYNLCVQMRCVLKQERKHRI